MIADFGTVASFVTVANLFWSYPLKDFDVGAEDSAERPRENLVCSTISLQH
jgi:hypothetical protein